MCTNQNRINEKALLLAQVWQRRGGEREDRGKVEKKRFWINTRMMRRKELVAPIKQLL